MHKIFSGYSCGFFHTVRLTNLFNTFRI